MIITEAVLKTFGVCGLVGAGTIAINEINRSKKKKADHAVAAEEVAEENVQECEEIPSTSFTVDSDKLEKILLEANYPQDKVKEFVNDIKNNAAPDKTIVTAETIEPQGPKFTVVDEPKTVQPDFSKNKTTKKTNNKTSK